MSSAFASDGGAGRTKTTAAATEEDDGVITVCLDPGHGFDDVGTDSAFLGELAEKDPFLAELVGRYQKGLSNGMDTLTILLDPLDQWLHPGETEGKVDSHMIDRED